GISRRTLTFTLDSSTTRCFFRDCTTVTPLTTSVPVTLPDPSGEPVVARGSTVLPCLAAISGSLTGVHLPKPSLLWHHRLYHPSLPRLCSMHSHLLVSGLPRSLPPLPRSLAPSCLPCVEGRQRTAPHSSFHPTTVPLQTLHMDVWGPARITGQGGERYFPLTGFLEASRWTKTMWGVRPKQRWREMVVREGYVARWVDNASVLVGRGWGGGGREGGREGEGVGREAEAAVQGDGGEGGRGGEMRRQCICAGGGREGGRRGEVWGLELKQQWS
ncbi:unnamed protein product, partial [Closterium sp. NIES-53]